MIENLFLELGDEQLFDAFDAFYTWKASGSLPTRPVLRQIIEKYGYNGRGRAEAHLLEAIVARWREEHKH